MRKMKKFQIKRRKYLNYGFLEPFLGEDAKERICDE
jgi:hypothetical protein